MGLAHTNGGNRSEHAARGFFSFFNPDSIEITCGRYGTTQSTKKRKRNCLVNGLTSAGRFVPLTASFLASAAMTSSASTSFVASLELILLMRWCVLVVERNEKEKNRGVSTLFRYK